VKQSNFRVPVIVCALVATLELGVAQTPETTPQAQTAPSAAPALVPYQPSFVFGMIRYDNKAYILQTAIWKTSFIPVCWEHGAPNGDERGWVRDAIAKSWESPHSALQFIGWGDCATSAVGIRIVVKDDGGDDGPHTVGLGKDIDGKAGGMVLNFTFKTWGTLCAAGETQRQLCIRSIAVHEFGHAIGFAHEQNRPDTPGECALLAQGPSGDTVNLTPWDANSVMNYCNAAVVTNGVLTSYLNNGALSQYDLAALQHFYGS